MKRTLFITIFLLLLSVLSFGKNEISVTYIDGYLRIQTRIAQLTFNALDGVLNEMALTMETYNKVYGYGDDGFDLFIGEKAMIPDKVMLNNEPVESLAGKTKTISGDVTVDFYYGDMIKRVTIPFGPYYQISIDLIGDIPAELQIALPRLADFNPNNNTDRVNENGKVFTSYYQKTGSVAIWEVRGGETLFRLDGSKYVNQLEIPVAGLHINGYIGPVKKMTFIQTVFPEENVWLSRTINSYPKATSWYDPLFYLLVYLMDWLYGLTKNYGWVLILYTLIVRFALLPLTYSQTKSMITRKKLEKDTEYQKIMKIQDAQKKQKELMDFYKRNKASPAAGCLPTLLQLPVFLLLYAVIRYESELFAFGPSFLMWQDLSIGGFSQNILIVLISFVINFFNTLITSSDTKQAKQGLLMAGIFPFLFITLATGLQIYWVAQSIFQWVFTWYLFNRNQVEGISIKEFFKSFQQTKGDNVERNRSNSENSRRST
jgi:YidC/Oxa1 family membrane protein insertase